MRLAHLMKKGHLPVWLLLGHQRMCETCDLKPPSRGRRVANPFTVRQASWIGLR